MIKVKFTWKWTNSYLLNRRIVSNYVTEDNYNENILFTHGNDYDYLFAINGLGESPLVGPDKIFTFIMEPSWSLNWDRNCFNYSNKVFVHDKILYGNYDNIVECPSFMFYHMDYNNHTIMDLLNNDNYEKTKKISMVVSYTPGDDRYNYGKRTNLALKIIEKGLNVDIYGNNWSNTSNNIKGPVLDKYNALCDYRYSIGIENCCEKNYLSEKFFDTTLCNGVPIYYGTPNVNEIFDNYISIDINNIEMCLDTISDLLSNQDIDYDKIKLDKLKYFNNYNIYNTIKQIVL